MFYNCKCSKQRQKNYFMRPMSWAQGYTTPSGGPRTVNEISKLPNLLQVILALSMVAIFRYTFEYGRRQNIVTPASFVERGHDIYLRNT